MKKSIVVGNQLITGSKGKIEKLEKMFEVNDLNLVKSVKEYIEQNPSTVLSERISKKGVKLITVQLPKVVKEFQLDRVMSGRESF